MDPRLNLIIEAQDRASRTMDDVGKSSGRMGTAIKAGAAVAVAALATIGVALVGLAAQSVTAASDLAESINAVNVVFGEASGPILAFGQTAADSVGLSARAFNELATPLGALLQNTGLEAGVAAEQTIALTQRAADLASVFNTDVVTALEAINSGLKGEADPLEQFGIGLSQARLQAFALSKGIEGNVADLSDQQIALLRIQAIMEQSDKVAGDFANTNDSLANVQRRLSAHVENLQAQLGAALLPAIEKVAAAALIFVMFLRENAGPAIQRVRDFFANLTTATNDSNSALEPLKTAWQALSQFFSTVLVPIVQAIAEEALPRIQKVIDETVLPAIEGLQDGFQAWGAWIQENVLPVIASIGEFFTFHMDTIRLIVGEVLDLLITYFQNAFDILVSILGVFGSLFTGDWEKIKAALLNVVTTLWASAHKLFQAGADLIGVVTQGLRDRVGMVFRDMANSVLGSVQGMVNGFIGGINAIIRAWNGLEFSFGGGTGPFGVEIPSFNVGTPNIPTIGGVTIPRLQTGGMLLNDGLIYAHRGERITPAAVDRTPGGGQAVTLVIGNDSIDAVMFQGSAEYAQINGL